jgi:site-specific DNA-methyltransferase (adenine-specific)
MIELLNADCMDYMATLSDAAFDLAIVDPPYGRGEDGGKNRSKGVLQKNGTVLQCLDGDYSKKNWDRAPPPLEYFDELRRVARHQIIWGANYMPVKLQGGAIVWDKVNDGSDQSGAEIAYCSLNERVDVVRYMWRGMMQGDVVGSMRQQGNKKLNERRIHPTQKPVKLYEWLLQKYAKPGMRILDTHLGSGSIAIAAHRYGVDLVGCEIDADYWREAKERFEAETRNMTLLNMGIIN